MGKFKSFLKFSEETSTSDNGLMGFGVRPKRKPSDGHPFVKYLKSTGSGEEPTPQFMKKMKKKMKKR